MAVDRRMWCSCTIIDYLKGAERAKPCIEIIEHQRQGVREIVTSVLAEAEVAHLGADISHSDAEAMIKEFFGRLYIVRVPVDRFIAEEARRLVRSHSGLKALDAVHIATALRWKVPLLETFDDVLLALDGKEGDHRWASSCPSTAWGQYSTFNVEQKRN